MADWFKSTMLHLQEREEFLLDSRIERVKLLIETALNSFKILNSKHFKMDSTVNIERMHECNVYNYKKYMNFVMIKKEMMSNIKSRMFTMKHISKKNNTYKIYCKLQTAAWDQKKMNDYYKFWQLIIQRVEQVHFTYNL